MATTIERRQQGDGAVRGLAVEAKWAVALELARHARMDLAGTRERLRVAVDRAADRRRLLSHALAAGQEGFARGLRDAAEAHEAVARDLQAVLPALERRCAVLEARASAAWREMRDRAVTRRAA